MDSAQVRWKGSQNTRESLPPAWKAISFILNSEYIHLIFPLFQWLNNNATRLLNWAIRNRSCQLGILRKWTNSKDERNVYFYDSHRVEQLALVINFNMSYRQFLPKFSDHSRYLKGRDDWFNNLICSQIHEAALEMAAAELSQFKLSETEGIVTLKWATVQATEIEGINQSQNESHFKGDTTEVSETSKTSETAEISEETLSICNIATTASTLHNIVEDTSGSNYFHSSEMLLMPTYQGHLQSVEDACRLVEACLRGDLRHSCRGPQNRGVVVSGNIFVWEAHSTGIDSWRDRVDWIILENKEFEVSVAADGSGLMKKTVGIRACGTTHNVVSYFMVWDI